MFNDNTGNFDSTANPYSCDESEKLLIRWLNVDSTSCWVGEASRVNITYSLEQLIPDTNSLTSYL